MSGTRKGRSMSDLIRREDAIKAVEDGMCTFYDCYVLDRINAIPSADRPQEWVDKAISIIDDMQREGIIDYEQAWEFRMRARMKGADDE